MHKVTETEWSLPLREVYTDVNSELRIQTGRYFRDALNVIGENLNKLSWCQGEGRTISVKGSRGIPKIVLFKQMYWLGWKINMRLVYIFV